MAMASQTLPTNFPPVEKLMANVARKIGYPSIERIPDDIRKKIANVLENGRDCIHIRYLQRVTPIVSWTDARIIGKDLVIESHRWASLLNHMQSPSMLCCFVITLGKQMDDLIATTQQASLFDAFVLDAFGSVIAEDAADRLSRDIKDLAAHRAYEFSRRFSPGYCDWMLASGQDALCRFLTPRAIDLLCLPTGAMVPEKSISAVMIGARHVKRSSPCFFCDEHSCTYRRVN